MPGTWIAAFQAAGRFERFPRPLAWAIGFSRLLAQVKTAKTKTGRDHRSRPAKRLLAMDYATNCRNTNGRIPPC